ncbi:MAG: hypothetical protein HQK86_02295 [Nitrospinae bacterium]|nr:hypothetical protein [Nitrospinota bacterium]MBF0633524.1 hypothetical protein [Nitrospinota bacterium]
MSHQRSNRLFTGVLLLFAVAVGSAFIASCGSGSSASNTSTSSTSSTSRTYPMFTDANGNGVNDYFEQATHDSGASARMGGVAVRGHSFVDNDGDGICDYAQNGTPTWHGPGFVDDNGNGVCDYWENGTPMYGQNGGMMVRDQNGNGVNDYFEQDMHQGYNHDYVDLDGDGICDYAQNGTSSIFHGPGFTDANGDGVCDHWESGGNGWGGMMGQGGSMMNRV